MNMVSSGQVPDDITFVTENQSGGVDLQPRLRIRRRSEMWPEPGQFRPPAGGDERCSSPGGTRNQVTFLMTKSYSPRADSTSLNDSTGPTILVCTAD